MCQNLLYRQPSRRVNLGHSGNHVLRLRAKIHPPTIKSSQGLVLDRQLGHIRSRLQSLEPILVVDLLEKPLIHRSKIGEVSKQDLLFWSYSLLGQLEIVVDEQELCASESVYALPTELAEPLGVFVWPSYHKTKREHVRRLGHTPSGLPFWASPHGISDGVGRLAWLAAFLLEGNIKIAQCDVRDCYLALAVASPVEQYVVGFHVLGSIGNGLDEAKHQVLIVGA